MSSNLIHKAIFDVTIDTSEKEGNAVSNMLFERNVRPALEEVLQQFENDDMIIEHSIELNIGTITEGELEHSIAEKLRQALLKYRHDGGVLSNYNHFIELKTNMLLDYIQKPVVPWSIDRVKGFDLQQLLRESIQKAMKSEVYLEQMTTLLSDSIEACKRFFELPFQQTDFYILLERLVSKSPIFRGRISSDVIKLFREESEFDFLLSKEIMHYLLSCSLFGSKQENILSLMIVRLLSDRWHSKKSMKSRKPIKETIVSSSKMILAQDLQDRNYAYPLPITASASDAQDGALVQSYVATGLPDTIPAPSSIAAYIPNHQSETSLPSSSVADFPDTVPIPSSVDTNISNHQNGRTLPSSSVADFPDTVPIPSSINDDAKEQGKGASSDFYKLNTESIASSDIALGLSWTPGDRGELHETNSNPRNTNSSQSATKSDGIIKKLQQLIRNINRIAEEREHFSDVITDIEQVIKEIQSDEQWKLLLGSNESSAYALQKELLRLKNQTKEDPKQAKELSEGDNITEEDALQIAKAIESLRKVETIEEQERPEKGIRELTAVIMRTQPDLKERIPIYNAGLVLFQPFLISFFDRLGLLESRKHFKSATCQIRAAHLLHELSGFGEIPVEHLMLFNKLLCGINIMFPIDCRFKISETESLEMEHLLRATIGNWAIIRNTSISGFQESFVKRQGVLERSQDDWILRVETKGIDILLDDIPWDIHLISFPWNNYLVYVDWHL